MYDELAYHHTMNPMEITNTQTTTLELPLMKATNYHLNVLCLLPVYPSV